MPTNLAHSSQKFNPFHRPLGEAVLDALRPFNLKGGRGGQYRCNSPFRSGANSHSFCLKIEAAGESGCWWDAVSGESGSIRELADRLGILDSSYIHVPSAPPAPPKPKPARPPKPAPPASTGDDPQSLAEAYAAEHGIPYSVFVAAGWSVVIYQGRPALKIPTREGYRYRFLDEAKPKYKSPPGYKQCLYGLQRALKIRRATGLPLILANGEASTVAAQHHGIPAFTIAGKGEGSRIPDHILNKLKANCEAIGGKIIITYDADDAGHIGAHKVAGQLREIGFEAISLDFGDDKPEGYDLADHCKNYPENAAERLFILPELPAPDTGATLGFDFDPTRNSRRATADAVRFFSILAAQLDLTAHNKTALLALWGIGGNRSEFACSNATFGKHLRKCAGEIHPTTPDEPDLEAFERKCAMATAGTRAWQRLEGWQSRSGIVLVERQAGFRDAATGDNISSTYRLHFPLMIHEGIEAARNSPDFRRSPGKAIEKAARELAARLIESARPPARTDEPAESAPLAESADDARTKSLRRLEKLKIEISEGLRSGALRPEDVSAALGEITGMIFSRLPDEPPEGYAGGPHASIQGMILEEHERCAAMDADDEGGGYKSVLPPPTQIIDVQDVADVDFAEFADLPEFPRTDAPEDAPGFRASDDGAETPDEPEWVADQFTPQAHAGPPADVLPFAPKDDLPTIEARRWDVDGLLDLLPGRLECADGSEWMKPAENVRRWLAMLQSDDRGKRDEASVGLAGLLPDVCAHLRGAGATV